MALRVCQRMQEVRLYPNASNRATIWGKPIGTGSVDFSTILPLLHQLLPDPDNTSCHIKLRLPPETTLDDTHAWMCSSLSYLQGYDIFPQIAAAAAEGGGGGRGGKGAEAAAIGASGELECRSMGRDATFVTNAKL
jgi:hypothetical protein